MNNSFKKNGYFVCKKIINKKKIDTFKNSFEEMLLSKTKAKKKSKKTNFSDYDKLILKLKKQSSNKIHFLYKNLPHFYEIDPCEECR